MAAPQYFGGMQGSPYQSRSFAAVPPLPVRSISASGPYGSPLGMGSARGLPVMTASPMIRTIGSTMNGTGSRASYVGASLSGSRVQQMPYQPGRYVSQSFTGVQQVQMQSYNGISQSYTGVTGMQGQFDLSVTEDVDVTREERVVEVPMREVVDKYVEVPEVQIREVTKEVVVPEIVERTIRVRKIETVEKVVEIPQIQVIEKLIDVPQVEIQEVVREVPKVEIQEVIREVPVVQTVERVEEVVEVRQREVMVDVPVDVPHVQQQTVFRDVPVPVVQERRVTVPREVQKIVPVPQVEYRDIPVAVPRPVEVVREVPVAVPQVQVRERVEQVERYIDQVQDVPVTVDVPYVRPAYKQKTTVPQVTMVEVPQPPLMVPQTTYVEVPQPPKQVPQTSYAEVEQVMVGDFVRADTIMARDDIVRLSQSAAGRPAPPTMPLGGSLGGSRNFQTLPMAYSMPIPSMPMSARGPSRSTAMLMSTPQQGFRG
mmetsp:Transcript_31779/g.69523  ORF Transcript_31779/g.69523 Transcript_31779/m.69523 type:complete len:484 (-) Transcript_31779:399-1850(-)|eukprot:CAMPEP_0204265804 /NCGR_PEP_ID=MMETSP0468-20130131/9915_1 /ASSEMBLY_ACC=CAM_ASM_000383 /TAXON_ID=2969 /ORGANISM="Oxyrrhis marina" /LENGTH=483 /DNA_ID=CAMNT_0051240793 /DNA_START=47 /DNA_END=1498 /DNA_ORIENTATION=+